MFTEYGEKFSIKTSTIMLLGGLLLTGSWINGYRDFIWFSNVEFIQFGIPFFLIVLGVSALDIKKPIANNSAQRIAVFLGDASYSIYLTHFIVIQICSFALNKFIQVPTIYSFYISVLASFLIGCGSYILIEKPLMKKLSKKHLIHFYYPRQGVMRE